MCWGAGTARGCVGAGLFSTERTTVTDFRNSASQFTWYLSLKLALEFGFFFFFSQEPVVKTFTSTIGCRALGRLAEDQHRPKAYPRRKPKQVQGWSCGTQEPAIAPRSLIPVMSFRYSHLTILLSVHGALLSLPLHSPLLPQGRREYMEDMPLQPASVSCSSSAGVWALGWGEGWA